MLTLSTDTLDCLHLDTTPYRASSYPLHLSACIASSTHLSIHCFTILFIYSTYICMYVRTYVCMHVCMHVSVSLVVVFR
jgi:hypothetical protein